MAKDGFLTAKAIGNRIKAKGLQKLRWYCQICEKQCRDENGFKCHCASESHQRKILLVAESPEKYVNDYSAEFLKDFMKLLSTRYGTRRVNANLVYQEFIADRTHLHMNATKWATLSEFTMHLGKEGLAIVDETPKGWFMQWIDNSPKTLARQEAILKKERMELDDEQREQRLIQQQIDKAMALKQQQDEADGVTTELVRENEEEKIKLDISIKPVGLTGGIGGGVKLGGGLGGGLLKPKSLNALAAAKKSNPFSSKSSSTPTTVSGNGSAVTPAPTKKRSPVEEIMEREMAKKKPHHNPQAVVAGALRSNQNRRRTDLGIQVEMTVTVDTTGQAVTAETVETLEIVNGNGIGIIAQIEMIVMTEIGIIGRVETVEMTGTGTGTETTDPVGTTVTEIPTDPAVTVEMIVIAVANHRDRSRDRDGSYRDRGRD
ncbi:hypothetical protein BGZ97_007165 [Linnemannia gamsii]|uniref:DNA/RNA-binding protein Kin17 WH-like domain-containing protein n=1 Tax=Linnemannia gamsii TaxID=64522 RepID=A0A9P6UQD6_9FUNG|nr:hypothetical protein BGZ97_007165 [Linnemannia gamsii]